MDKKDIDDIKEILLSIAQSQIITNDILLRENPKNTEINQKWCKQHFFKMLSVFHNENSSEENKNVPGELVHE